MEADLEIMSWNIIWSYSGNGESGPNVTDQLKNYIYFDGSQSKANNYTVAVCIHLS